MRMACTFSTTFARTASWIASWRKSRLVELQDCPCQVKFIADTAGGNLVDRRIREDDERVLAPQFERDGLHRDLGGGALNGHAGLRRSHEGKALDPRMARQRFPHNPVARDDVDHAGGQHIPAISAKTAADSEHCSEGFKTTVLPAISGAATPWIAMAAG
jgi:hypothetical protein